MFAFRTPLLCSLGLMAASCAPDPEEATAAPPGVPVLGGGAHDIAAVRVEALLSAADGLALPRDLDLNPQDPTELWVLNRRNDSMLIAFDVGTAAQTTSLRNAPGNTHFMPEGSAFAFGKDGTFATAHEEDTLTQGPGGTPADFMGPTLWDTDEMYFDGGHPTHLDMLHNSPNAMGIAWEQGNAYWVFDGFHGSITRYDFAEDHGYGGEDHSDGVIQRYAEGLVQRVEDVPSHMDLDHDTGLLYIADTGNNRVAVLDTSTGTRGTFLFPNYDGAEQYAMNDAALTTLIEGAENYHGKPSGLALHDGLLFIGDYATGEVVAYTLEGELVDYLSTGLEQSLMGIAFDEEGRLYAIDSAGERVLRYSARK